MRQKNMLQIRQKVFGKMPMRYSSSWNTIIYQLWFVAQVFVLSCSIQREIWFPPPPPELLLASKFFKEKFEVGWY